MQSELPELAKRAERTSGKPITEQRKFGRNENLGEGGGREGVKDRGCSDGRDIFVCTSVGKGGWR